MSPISSRTSRRCATASLSAVRTRSERRSACARLLLGLFGEGVVHWPTLFSVGLFPIIAVVYYLLARKEERAMLVQLGDAYRVYMSRVPMVIPRWGQWRSLIKASGSEA
jgi:hypothetical protein